MFKQMFKQVLFQLHWLLGISAGLVLAIMGISGATLSFEDEILQWVDPTTLQVPVREAPLLTPPELVRRVEDAQGKRVAQILGHAEPDRSVRIRFEPLPGQLRASSFYFDPYTAAPLGEQRGKAFFEFTERLHRNLVAGERGKAITGISVLALIFFCLSGLYLRWPKKPLDWRSWLKLDTGLRGRSLFWALHSIIGTWCLLFYLLLALTGLYWSYDWYRDGLQRVLVGKPVATQAMARPQRERGGDAARLPPPAIDINTIWAALRAAAGPGLGTYNLRLPERAGQPVTVSYLIGPAKDRVLTGANQLRLDAQTGEVQQRILFAERSFGAKLYASVYALHVGSYFGLPGRVLVMLASLAMPLFFVTGWLLYLDRRRKKRQIRAARGNVSTGALAPDGWLVGFASQSGFAEQLAWQSAGVLQAAGLPVQVKSFAQIDEDGLRRAQNALFVVSTFGDGEPPDSARGFERKLLTRELQLPGLRYGLLALGDRQYESFCGFAHRLHQWLERQGAGALFAPVEVDNADHHALSGWQQQLSQLTGVQAPAFAAPGFERWTLAQRQWLNPASQGAPTFLLGLQPPPGAHWEAGDVLEVQPRHAEAAARAFAESLQLDAARTVYEDGQPLSLLAALARRQWPDDGRTLSGIDAQALVDALPRLGTREYSIASLPADGRLDLLVRQAYRADGSIGLGSGWLTVHAPQAGEIEARLRRNSGFHAPDDARALILIGNGTGLAGLRSLLKARERQGHGGNWLIFGERNSAHDFYFRSEIEAWQASGHLRRLDLAFSRDQAERVYVQQRLHEAAAQLRHWLDGGAAIYVCGSLLGMADGVDRVLREVLGDQGVEHLIEAGRYRRDVY